MVSFFFVQLLIRTCMFLSIFSIFIDALFVTSRGPAPSAQYRFVRRNDTSVTKVHTSKKKLSIVRALCVSLPGRSFLFGRGVKHQPQVEVYTCRIWTSSASAFTSLSLRFHFVLVTAQIGSPCARAPLSPRFHFAFTSTRAERRYDSARCERPNAVAVRACSAASFERRRTNWKPHVRVETFDADICVIR